MIYEKKCPHCGKEFETRYEEQNYCSRACRNKSRGNSEDYDHFLKWERDTESKWNCPYESGVVHCRTRKCSKCGWNPVVAKARLDTFIAKYEEEQNG